MSGWERVRLGEVLALDVHAVDVDVDSAYPLIGVLNRGRGLLYRDPMPGSETKYKTLNLIRPGQVVYSRLKAFEGAITVAPEALSEAYASQEFPTFTCGPRLLPAHFALLTTTPGLWDDLQNLSTGMGGRRERVKPADFLTVRLSLPTVAEQRRIVAVIGAVDAQIEALQTETETAKRLLMRRREAVVNNAKFEALRGDEAFSILLGRQRSPQRAEGPHMTAYLRSANVGAGTLALDDVKQMDFDPVERETYGLVTGDVLVSEGSASENAVGMAAVWSGEIGGPICFQNTLLRYRAREGVTTADFTNHWCKWAYESGVFREAASGTNIKHIGSKRAGAMPVFAPPLPVQVESMYELNALEGTWSAITTELAALRVFRSTLLTSLLNESISIPESYDALLEGIN